MPMYVAIINMTRGFYYKCFIKADSIEQAREAAESRIDRANVQTFRVDSVTEIDSAAAMQEARDKDIEIMDATAHTSDPTDHTSTRTEPDSSSHSAAHDRTEASSTTHNSAHDTATDSASDKAEQDTNTDHGKRKGHEPRTTTAPQSVEEARQRIEYLYLPDVTGTPARFYHQAVMDWISGESWTDAPYMASGLAFAAGIMEGKRQERQRRRNRQNAANG